MNVYLQNCNDVFSFVNSAKSIPLVLEVRPWNFIFIPYFRATATTIRATPWWGYANRVELAEFELENGGQSDGAQHSKWCHSMANIKICERYYTFFLRKLSQFTRQTFQVFYRENLGQRRAVQHSQWSHSMVNINLYKSHSMHFYTSSHRFQDITIFYL